MSNYLAGRLASLILSLLVASVIIFCILEILPGDPAQFILGMNAQPDTLEIGKDAIALLLPQGVDRILEDTAIVHCNPCLSPAARTLRPALRL